MTDHDDPTYFDRFELKPPACEHAWGEPSDAPLPGHVCFACGMVTGMVLAMVTMALFMEMTK